MAAKELKALLGTLLLLLALTRGTIDMNVSEFQYLADHLRTEECRKLIASLHFNTFDLPHAIGQAELKLPNDISCVQQLLDWNSKPNGGKGKSHDIVVRRLKQLGRTDLANWLSNAAFDSLGKDFVRSVEDPFKMYEPLHLPFVNLSSSLTTQTTTEGLRITTFSSHVRIAKQEYPPAPPLEDVVSDPTEWTIFDTISWTIVLLLLLLVLVLLVYLTMASACCKKKRSDEASNKHTMQRYNEDNYLQSFDNGTQYQTMAPRALHAMPPQNAPPQSTPNATFYSAHDGSLTPNMADATSQFHSPSLYHSTPKSVQHSRHQPHQIMGHETTMHQHHAEPFQTMQQHQVGRQTFIPEPPHELIRDLSMSMLPQHQTSHQQQRQTYNLSNASNKSRCPCPPCPCPSMNTQKSEFNERSVGHFNELTRTIDIHQKIAIPMNSET